MTALWFLLMFSPRMESARFLASRRLNPKSHESLFLSPVGAI